LALRTKQPVSVRLFLIISETVLMKVNLDISSLSKFHAV
jgi:hypothetical protein